LQLRDEVSAANRVVVSVLVTNVNPASQELTARLGFRLAGDIAQDEVTPATDLQLLVNSVGGQQQYDFPAGKRMNRIEARFPLNGDWNRYPLDRWSRPPDCMTQLFPAATPHVGQGIEDSNFLVNFLCFHSKILPPDETSEYSSASGEIYPPFCEASDTRLKVGFAGVLLN
jgi:hypothetical protein